MRARAWVGIVGILLIALCLVAWAVGLQSDATVKVLQRHGTLYVRSESRGGDDPNAMRSFFLVMRPRKHGEGTKIADELKRVGWKFERRRPDTWSSVLGGPDYPYVWIPETPEGTVFVTYVRETTTMERFRQFLRLE